jgi:siroheme synthase
MGVTQRGQIAAELIAGGLPEDTPVAAIHSATTADEVTVRCRLDELADAPVESPAVLVIGAVAAFDLRGYDSAATVSANSSTVSTRLAIPSA